MEFSILCKGFFSSAVLRFYFKMSMYFPRIQNDIEMNAKNVEYDKIM